MTINKIIRIATKKGIMPKLENGIGLIFHYGTVRMVTPQGSYRSLFTYNDSGEVKLYSTLENKVGRPFNDSNSSTSAKGFIKVETREVPQEVSTKIGETLEQVDHTLTYTDVKGRTKTVKEKINRVIPVYDTRTIMTTQTQLAFYQGDE